MFNWMYLLTSAKTSVYDADERGVNRLPNPHGWFMEQKDPKFYDYNWNDPYYWRAKERITEFKDSGVLYFLG